MGQPVVPENAIPAVGDRRLDPLEWVELLEQTECLDYVSPDIDACLERHSRMEGGQEIEVTGREFLDSPAIPKLPSLNVLSSAERPTILKPLTRPRRNVSRRPGLREQFPRQPVVKREHAHQMGNYPAAAEQLVLAREDSASDMVVGNDAPFQSALAVTKEADFALDTAEASGARPKDARTRPSLEDSARVMEEERDAAPKDAPRAAKQEDFAEATDRLA
ncbi:hypothetical protein PInf_000597 [Phytophthora infestans]|nr:hypothetical protein PInf_000597 [Phytophthora infestans]